MTRLLLWVDDRPKNNEALAAVLKAGQATVVTVLSTDQAIKQLKARRFDAVVSDMGRREGPEEGYVLLDWMKSVGLNTPFFIFAAGASEASNVAMALARGAAASTSLPSELLLLLHKMLYPGQKAVPTLGSP
jgi:DNA-binding NtrC family response regulator